MRRSNGQGTFYTESSKSGTVYCWRVVQNGKTIVRKRRTKAELKAAIKDAKSEVSRSPEKARVAIVEDTVGGRVSKWMETVEARKDASTFKTYRSHAKVIDQVIGSIPMDRFGAEDVQKLVDHDLANGATSHTVDARLRALATALRLSRRDWIKDGLTLPAAPEQRERVLTDAEMVRFLKMVSVHREGDLFLFLLNTGLRIGEALGLPIHAINLREEEMRISVQRKRARTGWKIDKTKTGKARVVPLNGPAIEIVKRQLKRVGEMMDSPEFQPHGLLFCTSKGTPLSPTSVRRTLQTICRECHIDETLTVHDLRRTWETRMAMVEPRVAYIAAMAGHSPATAQKYYILADRNQLKDMASKVSFG